ncbi:MAG TPA: hypothetical protein VJN93_03535 [Candidatus Acidoferrum sp.]|nr:hypothetical protein [Candidatus Acidoferrum sp.]
MTAEMGTVRVRGPAEQNKLFGMTNRQVSEHHRVENREDGCVGANSEGEREYRDSSETERLPQCPEAEAQILPRGLHDEFPAASAHGFLCNLQVPSLQAHGDNRILIVIVLYFT